MEVAMNLVWYIKVYSQRKISMQVMETCEKPYFYPLYVKFDTRFHSRLCFSNSSSVSLSSCLNRFDAWARYQPNLILLDINVVFLQTSRSNAEIQSDKWANNLLCFFYQQRQFEVDSSVVEKLLEDKHCILLVFKHSTTVVRTPAFTISIDNSQFKGENLLELLIPVNFVY